MDDRENPNHPDGPARKPFCRDPDAWKAERADRDFDFRQSVEKLRDIINEHTVDLACSRRKLLDAVQADGWAP